MITNQEKVLLKSKRMMVALSLKPREKSNLESLQIMNLLLTNNNKLKKLQFDFIYFPSIVFPPLTIYFFDK